ncbi:type I-E CRISPR-associated protein Cse2/CasB [Microbacterium sp.]|uniref:type I-E CRISPR-associated protein Cse2/CasB n=1 Tax=Microbacterium sp. TaxID=51671 RepID=UPI003C71BBBF
MTTLQERADRVARFVDTKAYKLQQAYQRNASSAVADLARLRRGLGRRVGEDLDLIGLALASDGENSPSLLDERERVGATPTAEEQSAFTAITLFALHQQSQRGASMHRAGYSLGRSARLLGKRVDRDSVRTRFTALGTATTWDETVHHARGLIQQFRQHGIPLDYGRFARDLFDLRTGRGDRVRMSWGRDFYRLADPDDTDTTHDAATAD